ncbi:hypothetical protein BaRGS_00003119 [Batillaria attramentaria]|uniref:Uncharacterized protein n=1 Tax=Batillaria attramentaria TaxID=370345 RepID=A0ABD0M3L8_9CAEN
MNLWYSSDCIYCLSGLCVYKKYPGTFDSSYLTPGARTCAAKNQKTSAFSEINSRKTAWLPVLCPGIRRECPMMPVLVKVMEFGDSRSSE